MFTTLVTTHATGLVSVAIALLGSKAEAEDVVQDVFLRIWTNRESWDPQGSIGAYLATAVRRRAIDVLRHRQVIQRNTPNIESDSTHRDRDTAQDIEDDALWKAVHSLEPRWRETLILRYVQKLSHAEVGQALQISPDAARMVIGRALQALRKVFDR